MHLHFKMEGSHLQPLSIHGPCLCQWQLEIIYGKLLWYPVQAMSKLVLWLGRVEKFHLEWLLTTVEQGIVTSGTSLDSTKMEIRTLLFYRWRNLTIIVTTAIICFQSRVMTGWWGDFQCHRLKSQIITITTITITTITITITTITITMMKLLSTCLGVQRVWPLGFHSICMSLMSINHILAVISEGLQLISTRSALMHRYLEAIHYRLCWVMLVQRFLTVKGRQGLPQEECLKSIKTVGKISMSLNALR
jgi:hypothetical protein